MGYLFFGGKMWSLIWWDGMWYNSSRQNEMCELFGRHLPSAGIYAAWTQHVSKFGKIKINQRLPGGQWGGHATFNSSRMNRKAVKATCQGQASCGETNGSHQRNHGKTTASFSAASDDREIPWSKPYPGYLHTRLSYVVMLQGPFPDIQTGLASWLSTSSAKMCHYSRQVISFYQRGTPLQGRSFWTGPACDGPWIHWYSGSSHWMPEPFAKDGTVFFPTISKFLLSINPCQNISEFRSSSQIWLKGKRKAPPAQSSSTASFAASHWTKLAANGKHIPRSWQTVCELTASWFPKMAQ